MKIALFGASGMIGQRITQELLSRGHQVTAFVRNPANITLQHAQLTTQKVNILDTASVAQAITGYDVVVNATNTPHDKPQEAVEVAHSLLEALPRAGVQRLIVVGGAGSLEIAPGLQLVDTPDFPAAWRPGSMGHRDALAVYRTANNLDWTYFSPAAFIQPGQRTGSYRTGTEQLVTDAKGESHISAEDYAVALVDEIEKPQFIRRRFTVAY
jgi:putative NADH-flavin reductase